MGTREIEDTFKTEELGKCPFTGAGTPAKEQAGKGTGNRWIWVYSFALHRPTS